MEQPDYLQILEKCTCGVIGTGNKGNIIHINQKAKKIINFHDRVDENTIIIEILPATGKLILEAMGKNHSYKGRQIESKQEKFVVDINLMKNKNSVIGAVCSFMELDYIETVAKELDSIDLMDKKFETLFEASVDGLWLCDSKGRIIKINKATEKIMGLDRFECIGKKVKDIFKQGVYSSYLTDEVIRTKNKISQMQTALLTGKQILCTGIPILDKSGEVSMVVINERDLSQLITTHEQLDALRQEKDRYKDELTSVVMKELQENEIIAENEKMRQIMQTAVKFGQMSVSDILILGESGTGKGLTAKFINKMGKRSSNPFIQVNCAAIPDTILEAELFGYEKGAFSGAKESGKPGLIELANKGTLFLDEIGDLSPAGQAKLLKYMDDHEVMRLGGTKTTQIDCIVIAATNQNIEKMAENKKFRSDLLFRLNTPLRERPEDIFALTHQFLKMNNDKFNLSKKIHPLTIAMLQTYSFPGNIRELKNIIKKGVIMSESDFIDTIVINCIGKDVIDEVSKSPDKSIKSLDDITFAFEREILKNAMNQHNSTRTIARFLNTSQPTIVRKLKKHCLSTK